MVVGRGRVYVQWPPVSRDGWVTPECLLSFCDARALDVSQATLLFNFVLFSETGCHHEVLPGLELPM